MVAPDLEIAINFASQAVAADQAGDRATALARYMDAAGALLAIIKVERDAAKAAKLAARMETYVPPLTEAATKARARGRVSTGRSYFTADDKFRSDVAAGRAFCAAAEKRGGQYVDDKFQGPAALSRDGYALPAHSAKDVAGWVRGGALTGPDGRPVGLFGADGPRPRDVGQGALGDCWLLSSLSVLANFPELVRRLVWAADDSGRSAAGVFAARLCLAGEFRSSPSTTRCPPRGGRRGVDAGALWPAIVEKAAAKLHGSYGALDSGNAAEALGLLTGLPTRTWPKIHDMLKKTGGLDELHGALVHAHRSGFIISASCGFTGLGADEAQEEKIYDRVGLLNAHEYAVLRVVDVTVGAGKARLVQLRNPWAKREWRGPWSRGGPEWAALPEAARAMLDDGRCLASDDGVFWMALADVAKYFHEVTVCRLRRNFAQERPGLAPVVATGDLKLAPGRAYLLVPLCLNWRVLGIGSKHALAAVLYSSRPLQHVAAAGLAPDALAAAVRAAVIAKGTTQGGAPAKAAPGADEDERVYELDGISVENRRRAGASR
ncbi:calcium-dependent cysteine-type endopeptidase [Aureococcus anophagefferens]|nr:calcium-dependent cysteine-type endopeptidase [Aureococcus anophagefferens]